MSRYGLARSSGNRRCFSFFHRILRRLHGVLMLISHQKIRMGGISAIRSAYSRSSGK